ncbi:hypothetical protein EST35_0014 [Pseudomonas phage vB_PaeM_PA5oct]|uniref:Uncharacterized protein n=1 Tax=Pseudomonas phage vB_PaeM_PA5oct TaxID=2163605 RepID=A0A4Y5JT15_9CAUD|nr:hypothetical protein PQE65_gp014 [Pseudomonas phage vB_PaeM_PA5oct]QCG75898.1 hypothetical protein EST35_0014 [Pseudomonas phage vB_PaeM_PA5oct]
MGIFLLSHNTRYICVIHIGRIVYKIKMYDRHGNYVFTINVI